MSLDNHYVPSTLANFIQSNVWMPMLIQCPATFSMLVIGQSMSCGMGQILDHFWDIIDISVGVAKKEDIKFFSTDNAWGYHKK